MEKLLPNQTYHIYNHANGNENLFLADENYHYFLEKYIEHIYPVAETFAYCLLPNHFHLMVRIREKHLPGFQNLEGVLPVTPAIAKQKFSNFFNSYTKSINKKYDREGSLFRKNFKRIPVSSFTQFTNLIAYIHNNPVHHGFVKEAHVWEHSSYHSYFSEKKTRLGRHEALSWFGNKEEFKRVHRELKMIDVMLEFEV